MVVPIQRLDPDRFPVLLKEIPDPPKTLYLKGALPSEGPRWLCVVGSRKYTPYGKSVCEKLIAGLSGYPIVIVSGLALGIDGIAHEAALEAGLTTVAVPGSGLDDKVLYPRTHLSLAERILKAHGALVSEFEPTHRARPEDFPKRNRIMAALSHAVLVIEAEELSGTLITARLALDYNRDVLTVPGPLFSSSSAGPHRLIRTGATLIRSSDDILEVLGITKEAVPSASFQNLSSGELRVVELIRTPISREELIEALGLPISDINVLLSTLELKGYLVEELGFLRLK